MNERIHRHLDGELPLDELTARERTELASYRRVIQRAAEARVSEPIPDMTRAVMARIGDLETLPAAPEPSVLTRAVRWLWEPRTVRLRPAFGVMAAAFALVLVLAMPGETPVPVTTPMAEEGAEPGTVYVQFRLDAPGATNVRLAGSFTEWEPEYTLHEAAPGVWAILVPLRPGVHDYSFVIDEGEWRPDPVAPQVDDGFGGRNSRVAVLSPRVNSL
jgi:hypothetical protein